MFCRVITYSQAEIDSGKNVELKAAFEEFYQASSEPQGMFLLGRTNTQTGAQTYFIVPHQINLGPEFPTEAGHISNAIGVAIIVGNEAEFLELFRS